MDETKIKESEAVAVLREKKRKLTYKTEVQLFGERLERLGKALQNQDTPLTELSSMAHECGMELRLGLTPIIEV